MESFLKLPSGLTRLIAEKRAEIFRGRPPAEPVAVQEEAAVPASRPPGRPPASLRRGAYPLMYVPNSGRRISKYMREKQLGIRRENGAQKLKFLTARHLQILNLHIAGRSMEQIGEVMKLSLHTVWRVISDPISKEFMKNVYSARQQEIDALLGQNVEAIRDCLEDGTRKEKLQAVSVYSRLKLAVAPETNPQKTAEDVAAQIVANATNLQVNIYGSE